MPMSAQVHIWPKEIGCAVNERGNVEIVGMDRETGTVVKIEIHSAQWKHVLQQFGRMKGVGIVKPTSNLTVVTDDEELKNGA